MIEMRKHVDIIFFRVITVKQHVHYKDLGYYSRCIYGSIYNDMGKTILVLIIGVFFLILGTLGWYFIYKTTPA